MNFIFKNEFFVALEKESGVLTTPGRFGDKDPRRVLGLELQKELQQQIFPVHRLDVEVSGLVLFALTADAHREASVAFENKKVQKTYQALTENTRGQEVQSEQAFEWKCKILRGKKRAYEAPHGKSAQTLARFHGVSKEAWQWELRPITGRSHQLRFELARHGFPIWGDLLYGSTKQYEPEAIALKSIEISFLEEEFSEKWQLPKSLKAQSQFF
jgi:tRNA pseudouridine32 synthase/23S rRNA pseudouridine746 synthase